MPLLVAPLQRVVHAAHGQAGAVADRLDAAQRRLDRRDQAVRLVEERDRVDDLAGRVREEDACRGFLLRKLAHPEPRRADTSANAAPSSHRHAATCAPRRRTTRRVIRRPSRSRFQNRDDVDRGDLVAWRKRSINAVQLFIAATATNRDQLIELRSSASDSTPVSGQSVAAVGFATKSLRFTLGFVSFAAFLSTKSNSSAFFA